MSIDLFQLLPAVYRTRDAQIARGLNLLTSAQQSLLSELLALPQPLPTDQQAQLDELQSLVSRGPLQSLLMLIGEQIAAVDYDLDQLYDDQFIETCASWVIPYIGDLIGYQAVKGIASAVDNPRSEVANTISLRRRKGTVLVLEQLARDVTGWGAHAVELFQNLASTQYVKCPLPTSLYAPDLRNWKSSAYLGTGFDIAAHRVDVRAIGNGSPRYSVPNIGIFLWSLLANRMTCSPAVNAVNGIGGQACRRLHPLGIDVPLFHRNQAQGEDITAAAGPQNVPDALTRRALCVDLAQGVGATYYGQGASLSLYLNKVLLNPYEVAVADLFGNDGSWLNLPDANSPYKAIIDPELGRVALPAKYAGETLSATWFYGSNADIGGGEYERNVGQTAFTVTDPAFVVPFPAPQFADLGQAIASALALLSVSGSAAVEISGEFSEQATKEISENLFPYVSNASIVPGNLTIDLPAGATFELRAADETLQTLLLQTPILISGDTQSRFLINGLLIGAGASMIPPAIGYGALIKVPALRPNGTPNSLSGLSLLHTTLVPGWSLNFDGSSTAADLGQPTLMLASPSVQLSAQYSILGAIRSHAMASVTLTSCVLDATSSSSVAYAALSGTDAGASLSLNGCTVLGQVHAAQMPLVTNSIFWAAETKGWATGLLCDRKQQGCVRFSFLPYDAVTPPPFACVSQVKASPTPYFISTRYGQPGYMKLLACTDDSIRRGADNGNEMGVFNFLFAEQRENDLKTRLQEYLPVGLSSGLVYQN